MQLTQCLMNGLIVTVIGFASSRSGPVLVRVSPYASLRERLSTARQLLSESPLIDGHKGIPWQRRSRTRTSHNNSRGLDFKRLRESHVATQMWSVFVPCEAQFKNSVQLLLEQIDSLKQQLALHKNLTCLVTTSNELLSCFSKGVTGSILRIEGGHSLASSMGVIRALASLGVKAITLTHRCHTPWAECSADRKTTPNARGLTHYGKEIIRELNRLGIIIDLTHSSDKTARDVITQSKAPVIFSHAGARKLCGVQHNVPDKLLNALVANKGLIMVTFDPYVLSCSSNATIKDVIKHINHIRSMAGVDHLGISANSGETLRSEPVIDDISKYSFLFAQLLKDPSWSLQDLKKLAGLNFIRVLSEVEKVQEDLSLSTTASEAIVPIHDIDNRWPCRYKFASLDADRS